MLSGCRVTGVGVWKAALCGPGPLVLLLKRGAVLTPARMDPTRALLWHFWAGVSIPEFGGAQPCSRPWGTAANAQVSWGLFLHVLWEMAPFQVLRGSFSLELELLA